MTRRQINCAVLEERFNLIYVILTNLSEVVDILHIYGTNNLFGQIRKKQEVLPLINLKQFIAVL